MRTTLVLFVISAAVALSSCRQTPPTAPGSPAPPSHSQTPPSFSFTGYGEALDSTYYKVWSDSSWEEFYMDTTINGTGYRVLLDNTGYEYFYGPDGYDGIWPYGGSLIMFDSTLALLPDTMVEGKTYTMKTTFSTQGIGYVLTDQAILLDTGAVTVSFGTFGDCLHLQSTTTVSGGGQSQTQTTQYWYAKGPSDIKRIYENTGATIFMAYGVVNGVGWGTSVGKAFPGIVPLNKSSSGPAISPASTRNSRFSVMSMAPQIMKGLIR